jgi:two-component sensor histidine kinase
VNNFNDNNTMKLARIKNYSTQTESLIAITSDDKPAISEEIQNKWQKIVDLSAKIIGVPSGLITKLHERELEVFLTSKTEENIFKQNVKLDLGLGWYCETTAGTRDKLLIPNALKSKEWIGNPSIPFNMISYCGIPILWPDGEVFGTFCMLDNKENHFSELYKDLLVSLREIIQSDLNSILLYNRAQHDIFAKEAQLREVHHRVKNHFNLLISTLRLQSIFSSPDNNINTILNDVQSRITTISDIHDQLNRSMNLEKLLLGEYLNRLGKHIIEALGDKKIKYLCAWSEVETVPRISVPCGLILNELITNSLKYAFKSVGDPEISLLIKQENENLITLLYRDNGIGLPADINIDESNSLGINLIKYSVQQLEGNYKIVNDNGFVFQVEFKI